MVQFGPSHGTNPSPLAKRGTKATDNKQNNKIGNNIFFIVFKLKFNVFELYRYANLSTITQKKEKKKSH